MVNIKRKVMEVHYQIISRETGMVVLRNRRIAKSLRWWLKENGFTFKHSFYVPRSYYFIQSKDL
jgi:hypothetical protein